MVRVVRHARCDGHQSPGEQLVVDLELLVTGCDAGFVGHDPHLDEVDRIGVLVGVLTGDAVQSPRVVLLRVQDSGAGAHALGQSGVDDAGVAHRILVHQ